MLSCRLCVCRKTMNTGCCSVMGEMGGGKPAHTLLRLSDEHLPTTSCVVERIFCVNVFLMLALCPVDDGDDDDAGGDFGDNGQVSLVMKIVWLR